MITHSSQRPQRAARLAIRAGQLRKNNRNLMALLCIDRAIEYDQAGAIDHDYGMVRAEIWQKLGSELPIRAMLHYHHAMDLEATGRHPEAAALYLEAFSIDPGFLWPLNYVSWKLATTPAREYLNGPRSMQYATIACRQSHWNYWAFVNTLAAAYARCGLFNRAIYCQKRAMALAPIDNQLLLGQQLALFEKKKPYTDLGDEPAAGCRSGEMPAGTMQ